MKRKKDEESESRRGERGSSPLMAVLEKGLNLVSASCTRFLLYTAGLANQNVPPHRLC